MASLDGMPLAHTQRDGISGAAFLLFQPSRVASRIEFDGLEVEVAENSRFVLARGVSGDGFIPVVELDSLPHSTAWTFYRSKA